MPLLTRSFAKASLIYFLLALLIASLLAAQPLLDLPREISALRPVYIHFFVVGWLTQLIFGVMHWMFPKVSRERPRGNETLIWAVFITLNIGLVLRAFSETLIAIQPALTWRVMLAASAVLQWLSGLAFVANTWPRVKAR